MQFPSGKISLGAHELHVVATHTAYSAAIVLFSSILYSVRDLGNFCKGRLHFSKTGFMSIPCGFAALKQLTFVTLSHFKVLSVDVGL